LAGAEANKNAFSLSPKKVSLSKVPFFTSPIVIWLMLPTKVADKLYGIFKKKYQFYLEEGYTNF
jgi:hypothetical protein